MRIITHIFSFYFIAFLTSFVVEQEKKTRTLLAEKQSAFAQLDLLYRSIIESVDTGIMTVNLDGQIKSFNRAAAEITGLSFREVENRIISEVFPDFPPLPKEINPHGVRQAARIRFETTFHTDDGRSLIIGGSLSPLRDPDGLTIGNIIIFQDLTEINEMRESLEKSRRLAFIGEMAAGLAHEIRNPLASMSGSIQMLRRLSADRTHAKLMQIILRGKDQLESFLKDFLWMARPTPGVREEIDLKEIIRDVLDSLRFVPDWHEPVQIDLHLKNDSLCVHMKRTECRQVLWNVILNALQAMPEGGALTVEACGCRKDERDGVEIRIHDTGHGIEQSRLSKIFEPFYTTRDMGTGLGLAVVNRITLNIDSPGMLPESGLPRPVPGPSPCPASYRKVQKSLEVCHFSMPWPVSRIRISTPSISSFRQPCASMVSVPPSVMACIALRSTFQRTCLHSVRFI